MVGKGYWGSCCLIAVPYAEIWVLLLHKASCSAPLQGCLVKQHLKLNYQKPACFWFPQRTEVGWGGQVRGCIDLKVISQQESFIYHCEDKPFFFEKTLFTSTLTCL